MTDRFPSLEEIDGGDTQVKGDSLIGDSTSADDFLSRERAALGDDANQFSTPHDNMPSVSMEDDEDDLLGGGESYQTNGAGAGLNTFESSFPAIDTRNDHMAPGGTITGSRSPFLPGAPTSSGYSAPPADEPTVIKEWRERRDLAIEHREKLAADRKEETVKAAQTSIDEFYENYNNKKDKNITKTRKEAEEFLANRENTTAGGTSWERIAKLVDLKGPKGGAQSGVGKERFRELLMTLQKDENAPGAKGY